MTDFDTIIKARKVFQKRWLIMLILGVCSSIVFCAYKNFTGNFVIQSVDVLLGLQIQLTNYADRRDKLKYNDLNTSETILYDFYIVSKNEFDYNEILPGWKNKSDLEKIKWLKKHLKVNDYGAGSLEFRFDILKSEPKNLSYLKENGEKFLSSYINFLQNKELIGNYSITNKMASYPEYEVINKNGIFIKYGIIGFILGITLTYTIFFIKEICK